MPDDAIDTSDMPEVTDWTGAVRGRYARPKASITIRLDADLVEWFKSRAGKGGRGYQTRINDALRRYVETDEA